MILTAIFAAAALTAQDTPPGSWDPTSPEDVARRSAEGGSTPTSDDPLKGPDVPAQQPQRGGRGGDGAMQMRPTVAGLLEARCGECHGADKQKGGLQIIPVARLHEGPEKFRVIKPGDPDGSLLVQRIKLPAGHDDVMPPSGKTLSDSEVKVIEDWIRAGATEAQANAVVDGLGGMGAGASGRGQSATARDFLRAYMGLKDLTPEQRRAGIAAATESRQSLTADDKKVLEEFKAMQKAVQDGGEIPADLIARRQEIRSKLQALQSRARQVQTELWAKLDPEQQEALREVLAQRKNARGRRGSRPGGARPTNP